MPKKKALQEQSTCTAISLASTAYTWQHNNKTIHIKKPIKYNLNYNKNKIKWWEDSIESIEQ